jgi:hypothetical protein
VQFTAAIANRRNISRIVVTEGISLSQNLELSSNSTSPQEDLQMHEEIDTISTSWLGARCRCTKARSTRVRSIFQDIIALRWQRDLHHKPSCPLSCSYQRSDAVSVQIRSCSWIFSHILKATVSCTWGAGGYSIGQALAFHRPVSDLNPAFLLLSPSHAGNRSQTLDPPVNYSSLEEIAQRLNRYFQDGTICPTDVIEDHGTLLDVSNKF